MAESAGKDAGGCGELAAAPKAWACKAAAIEGRSFQTNCLPSLSGGGSLAGGALSRVEMWFINQNVILI